jgi:hypothetical protein
MKANKEQPGEGWITFDKLCEAWGKMPFEILEFMRMGLQAYSNLGRKVIDTPREYNGLKHIEKSLKTETARRIFWQYRGELKDSPFPTEPYEEFDFTLPIDKQKAEIALSKIRTFIFKDKDLDEFAQLHILPQQKDTPVPSKNVQSFLSNAGKKGGEKSKKKKPIIEAVMKHLRDNPKLLSKTNNQIAENFKKNVRDQNPISVDFDGCIWEVYFQSEYIFAIPGKNKAKHKDKSIAYTTFRNTYISDAKKHLKDTY